VTGVQTCALPISGTYNAYHKLYHFIHVRTANEYRPMQFELKSENLVFVEYAMFIRVYYNTFFFFGATVHIWALAYLHETFRFTSVY
jgi:hypothetical protein